MLNSSFDRLSELKESHMEITNRNFMVETTVNSFQGWGKRKEVRRGWGGDGRVILMYPIHRGKLVSDPLTVDNE